MKTGTRKLLVTGVTLLSLLVLGLLAGELSDGAVDAIADGIGLVCIAFCGGNGLEHLGSALSRRRG